MDAGQKHWGTEGLLPAARKATRLTIQKGTWTWPLDPHELFDSMYGRYDKSNVFNLYRRLLYRLGTCSTNVRSSEESFAGATPTRLLPRPLRSLLSRLSRCSLRSLEVRTKSYDQELTLDQLQARKRRKRGRDRNRTEETPLSTR